MDKFEWLDSDGNLNPEIFWSDSDVDWEELKKHAYLTPAWVRNPERYPEHWNRLKELGVKWSELLGEEKS